MPWLDRVLRAVCVLLAGVAGGCSDSTVARQVASPAKNAAAGPHQEVVLPEAFSPGEVAIGDEAAVIGVSTGELARAYLVDALTYVDGNNVAGGGPQKTESDCQVVNDLLGDVPVSVTYCARSNYCRVFTSRSSSVLHLSVADRSDAGLELLLDGKRFAQSDPNLPLVDFGFQTTSWGNWKSQHPHTDIYIGRLDEG